MRTSTTAWWASEIKGNVGRPPIQLPFVYMLTQPKCVVEGNLDAPHAVISPQQWEDPAGIKYEVQEDGTFRMEWASYRAGSSEGHVYGQMLRALRLYLTVEGFRQKIHVSATVRRQSREGPGTAYRDVKGRFSVAARLTLTDWTDGIAAAASVRGLEEAMCAYSEACSGLPYPLARAVLGI